MTLPQPRIEAGDCREVLPRLAAEGLRVDSVVTDPPYHLTSIVERFGREGAAPPTSAGATGVYKRAARGFMGKSWDGWDAGRPPVAFDPDTWRAVAAVMKPGAWLAAFAGTRGQHRMACAIEDAGLDIRDAVLSLAAADAALLAFLDTLTPAQQDALLAAIEAAAPGGLLAWVFGSGFPKSVNLARALGKAGDAAGAEQWAGFGTALKPAWECIVLARKPLDGRLVQNVQRHGCGGLNVDGCLVESEVRPVFENDGRAAKSCYGDGLAGSKRAGVEALGRWPANLVHDGAAEVLERFPRDAGAAAPVRGRSSDKFGLAYGAFAGARDEAGAFHGDSGSAARFFYSAKAEAAERPWHCACGRRGMGGRPDKCARLGKAGDDACQATGHPTVKPVALMRWLVRLLTPPGGTVLDPFAGTGSTGQAALEEGLAPVLIEREAESLGDIETRLGKFQWGLGL